MSQPAISVQGLGKRYQIGAARAPYQTLREALADAAKAPFRRFRQLAGEAEEQEHIWALKDVCFDVRAGEVVGIIGRNGAGKSTLLKVLSRITDPTEGRVVTRGRIGSLLEVGTGFHPELTGRENIFLNGAILGMTRREIAAKFDEIVAFAEIERFLDTPVKRYSSGMYVRLAFAVAAHLEPEILVVDEVLAVGDAAFQKKCLGKMGEVAGQGRTVLFVSHNMTAIRRLCERAIMLDQGRQAALGACQDVVSEYLDRVGPELLVRTWPEAECAPGYAGFRLRRVAVLPEGDRTRIDVHTPLDIEIEAWSARSRAALNFSVVVATAENVAAFNTASQPREVAPGRIVGTVRIPADFLNDETYSLRVLGVDQGKPLFDVDEVLSFRVHEGERAGAWLGKWIGVVRPALEWHITTERLESGVVR